METTAPPQRCRDAREHAALIDRGFALGVPHDYARIHHLRRQREPRALSCIGVDIHGRMQWLEPRAAAALAAARAAVATAGIQLQLVSAFRSIEYQLGIIERKLARGDAIADILKVNAAPGYSEHHSGRCVDVTTPGYAPLDETFEGSSAYAWLQGHAAAFGFSLSYPRANRHGIAYEPWHWCWHPSARP